MSKMKQYAECLAYEYIKSHPEMEFEEALEKLVNDELDLEGLPCCNILLLD